MNTKKLLLGLLALIFASVSLTAQIEAGKSINITIANVPEEDKATITNIYPVSDGGTVNMPFIGAVRAAGLRDNELAGILQSRYKSAGIYTNPTIQVISNMGGVKPNEETVTVGGQVRSPGPVPFAKELTLWGAIQARGGATEFGSMRRVKLIRNGSERTYDASKAQIKQMSLQRNDIIEVPQKNILGG
ncbi:MAG: polysaccharide biosynthesis/export family protein [Verrucomicrobiota bacterium]